MTSGRDRPHRLVLLGHPVRHSLSPLFQNAALRSAGLDVTYDALDVTPDALSDVLRQLARSNVAGNVTIPHKEAVAAACTRTTELAARVGAVNTFWHEKGELVGDNTDVAGARAAIAAVLAMPQSPADTGDNAAEPLHVTVLGAGGAAAGVLVALESFSPRTITVYSRTPQRAAALCARLGTTARIVEHLDEAFTEATLVINATPVGLGDDSMPAPVERLRRGTRVLDLVARAGETAWVRACRADGRVAEDGLRMLVEQGASAFERWFDMAPDRAAMWRALKVRPTVPVGRPTQASRE